MEKVKVHLCSDREDHEKDYDSLLGEFERRGIATYADFTAAVTPDWNDRHFDVLVFDWGGMEFGNNLLDSLSRELVHYATEHPNKEIVISSAFTQHAVKDAARGLPDMPNIYLGMEGFFLKSSFIGRIKDRIKKRFL